MGRPSGTMRDPLQIAVQQVDQWRRSGNRGRMPTSLWRLAAEAAVTEGVEMTATRLQLNDERRVVGGYSLGILPQGIGL